MKTSRRKVVKNLVVGVSALAAYNAFPTKWGTPIIEQVFLPAHAATSGQINGIFRGTVSVVGGIGSTENNFGEFIADVGDSIGDFFVSEAHANGAPFFGTWCVNLAQGNATFSGVDYFGSGGCVEVTGPVSGAIAHVAGVADYLFEVLSESEETISVEIIVTVSGNTVTGTGTLTRSNEPCECVT